MDKKSKKVVSEALKVLGKKNLALISHVGSFPAAKNEDTGFGSLNSKGAKDLIEYVSGVFNSIQVGPAGKTKGCDSSPYTSTIFSNNPLFIDLKQLTEKQWCNILSKETFEAIANENPNKDAGHTAYSYIYKLQMAALKEAYLNFVESKKLEKLRKEFEIYKHDNNSWLEPDALYEALSIEHGNDYWPVWKSKLDKNLYNPKDIEEQMTCGTRIAELEEKYKEDIDFYKFCQFVIMKQGIDTREFALKNGVKMIADRQVAFSDRDCWAYQSLFLDGWMLGCPPDYFSKDGQAWGFPVINPEMLFNADGSLGKGGEFMKNLFKKMFRENPGGVRIDHIVGMIDPWVYKAGRKPKIEEGAGRLYSSPEHEELSKYAIATMENLNNEVEADKEQRIIDLTEEQISKYGALMEKIVIAAAEEEGLDKDSIVCEDLGTLTNPVAAVMKKYDLQGMRLTQFVVPESEEHPYRCKNIETRTWAMVGTHDNEPISKFAKDLMNTHKAYLHAKNLVEDLFADEEDKDDLIVRLTQDAEFMTLVKLVEIFASKAENVQIFLTDFFQIEETYNVPGTSGDKNWSLRIPNDYAELETINLPLILRMAIEARGSEFAKKNKKLVEKLNSLCKK